MVETYLVDEAQIEEDRNQFTEEDKKHMNFIQVFKKSEVKEEIEKFEKKCHIADVKGNWNLFINKTDWKKLKNNLGIE